MSIRLLARELYKCQQDVDRLEKELVAAPSEKKEALKEALRRATAERDRLRRIMDGQIGR